MSGKYTDKQIYENRLKWAEFLMRPATKKGTDRLDHGDGHRCCLGHGCYALGIEPQPFGDYGFSYDSQNTLAPSSFVAMVGLKDQAGRFKPHEPEPYTNDEFFIKLNINGKIYVQADLVGLNDGTNLTPQEIGVYLKSVIMGGEDTPFKEIKIDAE